MPKNNPNIPFNEELLASETVYDGKIIRLTKDTIRLVNGEEALREVVHHSGGAAVVALNEKNEIALVRQYRHAVGREMVEIPAGKREEGEDPRETAIRELREEAGVTADHVEDFGRVLPTCAYCTEVDHIFLATGLHPCGQDLDQDEFLSVFWAPLSHVVQQVLNGEIDDAKTVSGVLRAYYRQLGQSGE